MKTLPALQHLLWFHLGLDILFTWWRHQMETFSALLTLCAGNSPVPGEFPAQRPVTRSFDVFFDVRPNKRLSKQSSGWWFETLSRSLWRHCNVRSHTAFYEPHSSEIWMLFFCLFIDAVGSQGNITELHPCWPYRLVVSNLIHWGLSQNGRHFPHGIFK